MDEQLLKDFIATAQAYNYNYDVVMPKFPELRGIELQVLKDYIATAEANNYNYAVVNPKFPEIFGSTAPQTTETVTETVVEEPKKKGFLEGLQERAIATESPSTLEEQPSLLESQETDDLTAFEQRISESSLKNLERRRNSLESRSSTLTNEERSKLQIVNNEIERRTRGEYTEQYNPLTHHINYLKSLSDSDLQDELSEETIEKYMFLGDESREYYSKEEHIAEVEKEIARREELKAREGETELEKGETELEKGETELERSARLQREIEANLNITPQQQQADEAFVPIPEGVATQDRGTAFTPTIQTASEDVTQEAADIKFAGQEAAKEAEVKRYKENQQLARELNQDEGVENFQVETVSTDIGARYDFGSKTFVQTEDKTYLAYPEGMTLEQARQEGKLMEFSTEEQARYFAEGGWKKDDEYMGSFLGETPIDRGDPFERRLDVITKDLINEEESLVVPEMQYLFEGSGFKFEETNTFMQGADAMRVTAPNGEQIVIDLDPSSIGYISLIKGMGKGSIAAQEARKLRSFMRMNQTEESKEQFELAMEQDKNKLKILREEEIAGRISQFNIEFENAAKEGQALNDMYESIEAQSKRFSNLTEADLQANPTLMAEYNQYAANVEAFNAKSIELNKKDAELEARGKQIEALAGAYFDMKEYQGTFLGRYRNQFFTGVGGALTALKRSFITEFDGFVYAPKEKKDDALRYAFNMIENNPEDLYFDASHMNTIDGIDEWMNSIFNEKGEDGVRAREIIEGGGKMSKEDAKFLRTFLEGQNRNDALQMLNLLRVKGSESKKPSMTPDFIWKMGEGGKDVKGLYEVSEDAVTNAMIQYKENYSKTRTKQEAFDRFFETGSIRLPANPYSQVANRDFDRGQSDVLRESFNEAFNFAFGETATEESIAKKLTDGNIFERVSLGVARSLPSMGLSMVNPIVGGAGMVLQSMDDINVEMDNNPAFDDVSEKEKLGIATLYGGTIGILENIGFRNLRQMKGLTNTLILKALKKAPKGASVKTLQQIVAQDIKSATARGGITLLGAGLAEFETGAAQQLADIGIKTIYNEMKEKEMFYDVADNALDVISQTLQAGFEEMLGGFMLGSIPATQAALTKQQLAGVDDATFQAYMEMVKDPEGKKIYVAKLKQQILESKGKDRKKLEDELDMYNRVQGIIDKMPDKHYVNGIPTDYTTQQKKVALQLLLEKQELMSSKEGKSPELTKSQQNRINEIDTQLEAIGTKAQQDLEARQEAEAAIPDIAQKEEQQKQQDMYDNAVTEQEKRDVEEMFGVPEGEMEGRTGPNIFMNKKGERTSEITAEQEVTRGRVIEMAAKAAKAISKVIPDTNIVLYETTAEFQNATGRQGRGFFGFDGTVHINLEQATETTVPHEIMHAVLFDKFGSRDPNDTQQIAMAKAATQMVSSVRKTIDAGSELAKRLDAFASKYEAGVQNEEQLSELFGIMAAESTSLKPRSRSAIVNFFKDIAKRFGIDLGPKFGQNDADVVELMNTLSRKVRTGETIVEEDVTALEGVRVLEDTSQEQGSEGEVGTLGGFREQKEAIDTPKAKDDSRSWVRDKVEDVDITTLEGRNFITNMYDYTNAGKTDLGNGFSIELFGGRNYVPLIMSKTGKNIGDVTNLAAFNSKAQAEGFIRNSLEGDANLFAPHSGTLDGSWQFQQHIFESLVDLVLDNKILSKKQLIDVFNSGIQSKEGKKAFDKFNGKNNSRLKNLSSFKSNPKELVRLLDIENNFSPDLRKILNQKIAADKTFQEAIGVKNLNEFHERITDPLNRGVVGGEIMTLIEFDPATFEVVQTKPGDVDHHPSFGWVVKAKIERIMQPTKFYKSYDVTDTYTKYNKDGAAVSRKSDANYVQANVTSSAGAIPKVATVSTQQEQEYTKTGRRQMGEFESTPTTNSSGEVDARALEQAADFGAAMGASLAKGSTAVNVARDASGEIVGVTFGKYNDRKGVYTFDVVVDESVKGKGVEQMLMEDAQYAPYEVQEKNPNVKIQGREQKEAPSQKYDDDVALRIIKENNALDNPMSTGAIEYLLVERYKFPLKKVRDMMTVNLDLFDTLPKSFANIKGGKTAGIKLYNRVQAFKQKLIENNSRRTKLTDAEVDAEVAKYRASLNDGRKLTEEQITAQTKSYRESLTRLSEKEIQAEVNEFRESLEKANKRIVVKGVLITGRNKLTPAQIDAEVQAYENSIRDRNNSKPELTEQQINDKTEKFRNDLNKKNKKKADRMSLEEMQEKTAAFKDKLVKKNNKRKAKLTEEEIMDKTIEYLQAQPEYKAEGKGKGLTVQQASMLSQLQKQVGIRPSQNIGRKIQKARTMVSESVRTRRDLQKAKASIRNFLRKTLPQSVYTTEEVLELINDITVATDENIEAVFAKVEEFVINKNTKILEAEIKAILEGKYEKTESGRRKAKGISLEVNKRIQYIKSKIVPKGSKLEEFQLREARLRAELQELNNKEVLTEEEQNRAVDVIIALQLNAANEMVTEQEGITDMNAASIKLDYLDNIADTLRSMIADGKSQLKDELKAEKERLNRDKTDAYEDITGNRIDFNSKGSKQKLDDETFGREQDEIATKVSERIVRFFRNIGRGIELIFVSAEALDGLMDKISKLPGEMFGGRMQELVTNKIDDSSIAFKARMMEQEAIIRDKMKELYGKKWVSAARSHSIIEETGIIARGKNLKLSQNQMYYLYNMYKDPANKASFRTMYGSDYKRVMAEMEAKLKPEVKAFADWQVNEYFPSLYNHYNDVYKKIYKTNMPLNQFYAGRIYRKNVDPQPIDLLGGAPMANNFISASSIKERVNNNAAIEAMNGTDALYSYLNEMEYFAAYAENVRDINRIFKDPNIKDAIEKINGKAVYNLIDGAIKTISNRGGQRTLMDRFVNAVTSTFVVARIAISPVIMIKQLTSMVTYMNDIGVANYMLYSAKNLVSLKSTMKEIYDNSVYVRDRKNESIFRVLESYNDNAMKKFIPNKVRTGATWFTNFLMFNTKFGDMTAILMGGSPNYSYYKAQAIKQGKTEEQAIKIAIRKFERDTKRTQQSQDLQDKDYFQNAGAATRFMGLFQTAPKQYLRKEIQAVRQLGRRMRGKGGKGTVFENFRTLVMYHAVAPTLFQYVAIGMPGLLRDWREDEDYPDLIRALFLGNLNSLIVFGEILNWGGDYATGKPWAGETTRALPLLSTLQKVILMQKKIDDTSPDKEYYQDMIDRRNAELLTLLGIPAPTVKKFYDNYGDGIDWNDPRDAVMKLLGYSEFQIKGSEAITGDKPRNIFDEDFRKKPKPKKRKGSNTRTEGRSGPSRSGRTNTGSGRTNTGSGRTNTGSGRR